LILDLSSPDDQFSVNDGIDKNLFSLKYITIDNVAAAISECGQGALLGKIDIQSAFRIIPVHPERIANCWACYGRTWSILIPLYPLVCGQL